MHEPSFNAMKATFLLDRFVRTQPLTLITEPKSFDPSTSLISFLLSMSMFSKIEVQK